MVLSNIFLKFVSKTSKSAKNRQSFLQNRKICVIRCKLNPRLTWATHRQMRKHQSALLPPSQLLWLQTPAPRCLQTLLMAVPIRTHRIAPTSLLLLMLKGNGPTSDWRRIAMKAFGTSLLAPRSRNIPSNCNFSLRFVARILQNKLRTRSNLIFAR